VGKQHITVVLAGAAFAAAFFAADAPAEGAGPSSNTEADSGLFSSNDSVYFPGCTALNMNPTSGMPIVPSSSPHFFQNVWLAPDRPANPPGANPPQIITLGKLSASPIGIVEVYLGGPNALEPALSLHGAGFNQVYSWYLPEEVPADGAWHSLTIAANTNLGEAEAAIDYPINPLTSMIPFQTPPTPGGFLIATGEIGDWGLFGPYGMQPCGQPSGTYYRGYAAEYVGDFQTGLQNLAARLNEIVVNTANGLRALGIPIDPPPSLMQRGDQDWFAHGPDPGYVALIVGPHGFKHLQPGNPVLGDPCQSSPLTVIGCK
jgi:hypothetical protein